MYLTYTYRYILYSDFMRCHEDMVMLRSTTGPYGRPVIEVAYGEMLLSLHRDCMGDVSSGRVVGVSTWCRPCWTYPGQHQCGLNVYYFLGFHTIKSYMYYVFKSIYIYYKTKTLVVSDFVLARQGLENVFDRPFVFKINLLPQTIFMSFKRLVWCIIFYLYLFI